MIILLYKNEQGQGMAEYALFILLIAIVVILILTLMGTQLSTVYSQIKSGFP